MSNATELTDFTAAACNLSKDVRCKTIDLYGHYLEWCAGCEPLRRRVFVRALSAMAGVRYGAHWIGGRPQRGFVGVSPRKIESHKSQDYAPPATPKRQRVGAAPPVLDAQVYQFLSDCCVVQPDAVATSFDLYFAYADWAEGRADKYRSSKMLTLRIRDALKGAATYGVHWVDGASERGFRGLRLK